MKYPESGIKDGCPSVDVHGNPVYDEPNQKKDNVENKGKTIISKVLASAKKKK